MHSPSPHIPDSGTPGSSQRREGILLQADSCVKCGLCLPRCPTYRIGADEAESPRGRIALIQGWLSGAIPDDPRLGTHLDRCLQCGACEQACPSLVPFLDIMDAARSEHQAALPPVKQKLRRWTLDRLADPRLMHRLYKLYLNSGLRRLARGGGLLRLTGLQRLERLGAGMERSAAAAPASTRTDKVLIFSGCVARHLDAGAQAAAAQILQRLGYAVELPTDRHCCGALHRHDGFENEAAGQLNDSRACYHRPGKPPVLGLASACTAELGRDPELSNVVQDACRFLADLQWPAALHPRPYSGRVLVHVPCSQANRLGDPGAALDLLRLIPGIELQELPGNPACCGGAGSYLFRQPELAQQLLNEKLEPIRNDTAGVLVTTNTGCAAHFRAAIEESGLDIQVCHPVELLARQLPT